MSTTTNGFSSHEMNDFRKGQLYAIEVLSSGVSLMEAIAKLKSLTIGSFRDGFRSILSNDNGVYGKIALNQIC